MIDDREPFVRAAERFDPPPDAYQRFQRRGDRHRRNQRIAAAVVAIAVAAAGFGVLARANRTQPISTPTPPATPADWGPVGLAFGPDGELYVSSCGLDQIYRVGSDGVLQTFLDQSTVPVQQTILCPWGLAFDEQGNLYVDDLNNNRIRKIDPTGHVTVIAGSGPGGVGAVGKPGGDGGLATHAHLSRPTWIALDRAGNLYIADRTNNEIRKVDTTGIITTISGTPTPGGGPPAAGSHPELDDPAGIAIGPDGKLYVADSNRARIRKIDLTDGVITTVAGKDDDPGYSGDGGPALKAQIKNPGGIVFDAAGNLFLADTDNHVIRKIGLNGIITTVVGTGHAGCPAEGQPARDAPLRDPTSVVIGPDGHLYFTDGGCNAVYELMSDGTIHAFTRPPAD